MVTLMHERRLEAENVYTFLKSMDILLSILINRFFSKEVFIFFILQIKF